MRNQTIGQIANINTRITNIINNSDDCEDCLEAVIEQLGSTSICVKDKLANSVDVIHEIYQAIKNNTHPYNTVSVIDLNYAVHMYDEYSEGMIEFIRNIADLKDEFDIDKNAIQNTIDKVQRRDIEFNTSIFGGERNPSKKVDIDCAMKNIEIIIDMEPIFDKLINVLKEMENIIDDNDSEKYEDQILAGYKVFCNSVRSCNFECSKIMLGTLDLIQDSLLNRTRAVEKIVPEYQLF